MENNLLTKALTIARNNWVAWKDVYEHPGPKNTNPLLTDPVKFKAFINEYSVTRTIRNHTHDNLRAKLAGSHELLGLALLNDNGEGLDRFEQDLKPDFGTHDGKKGLMSFVSKLAAFLRPEVFVASDQFSKKGLKIAHNRKSSYSYNYYADYLKDFEEVWSKSQLEIDGFIKTNGQKDSLESEPRFQRRVLDCYLMALGGRWDKK